MAKFCCEHWRWIFQGLDLSYDQGERRDLIPLHSRNVVTEVRATAVAHFMFNSSNRACARNVRTSRPQPLPRVACHSRRIG